jgi:hypothetical protein
LRSFYFDFGLAANLIARSLIGELFYELVSLDINIQSTGLRFGSSLISSEEFFASGSSFLSFSLGSLFAIIE